MPPPPESHHLPAQVIAQVVATYDALVGVALGAGLTYGFGALNRRQQQAREDKTRWYQARLGAWLT
jgi:hypothetical protein